MGNQNPDNDPGSILLRMKEFSEKGLNFLGEIKPMVVLCLPNGEDRVIVTHFNSPREKEVFFGTIHQMIKDLNATAIAMVAEAWVVKFQTTDVSTIPKDIRPSSHPNRIEIVSIAVETRSGESLTSMAPIVRSRTFQGESLCLGSWEDGNGTGIGRMSNWFL